MIWFLILNAGVVGGTIGPSPLTLDQCNKFADERTIEHEKVISTGINLKGEKLSGEQIDDLKNLSFRCVQQDERPQLGDRP